MVATCLNIMRTVADRLTWTEELPGRFMTSHEVELHDDDMSNTNTREPRQPSAVTREPC